MTPRRKAHEALTYLIKQRQPLRQTREPLDPWSQQMCYTVCRFFPYLNALLVSMLQKPVETLHPRVYVWLLMGVAELKYMNTAHHAVLNEIVEETRRQKLVWACGMINALLRRFIRDQAALEEELDAEGSVRWCLPEWILQRWETDYPLEWKIMADITQQPPPLTLRINKQMESREEYLDLLEAQEIDASAHALVPSAVILHEPMDVSKIPEFSKGIVSVQDASAQCAATLLDPQPGECILDACAAPGGKTIHLLELEPAAHVWACDVSLPRLNSLHLGLRRIPEALQKNLTIQQIDWLKTTEPFTPGQFDKILLDSPCSALGIIRRQPDLKVLRLPNDLLLVTQKQKRILESCWTLLRSGGHLLYVTCSVMPEENDGIIGAFLEAHPDGQSIPIEAPWGRLTSFGRQVLPGIDIQMDGFYFSMLSKK